MSLNTTWALNKCLCHKSLSVWSIYPHELAYFQTPVNKQETVRKKCTNGTCHTHNVQSVLKHTASQSKFWISLHGRNPAWTLPTIISLRVWTVLLWLLDSDCLPLTVRATQHQLQSNSFMKKGLQSWVYQEICAATSLCWGFTSLQCCICSLILHAFLGLTITLVLALAFSFTQRPVSANVYQFRRFESVCVIVYCSCCFPVISISLGSICHVEWTGLICEL